MQALTTAPPSPQVHWRRCRNARLRQLRLGHEQERRLGHEKERRLGHEKERRLGHETERLGRRNFEHVDEPPANRRNFEAVGRNAEAVGRNAEAVDAPKPIWQRSQSGAILAANAPSAEAEAPLPSLSRAAARRVGRHVIEAEAPEPNVWSLSVRAQDGARLARSPSSPSPCMHALTTAPHEPKPLHAHAHHGASPLPPRCAWCAYTPLGGRAACTPRTASTSSAPSSVTVPSRRRSTERRRPYASAAATVRAPWRARVGRAAAMAPKTARSARASITSCARRSRRRCRTKPSEASCRRSWPPSSSGARHPPPTTATPSSTTCCSGRRLRRSVAPSRACSSSAACDRAAPTRWRCRRWRTCTSAFGSPRGDSRANLRSSCLGSPRGDSRANLRSSCLGCHLPRPSPAEPRRPRSR